MVRLWVLKPPPVHHPLTSALTLSLSQSLSGRLTTLSSSPTQFASFCFPFLPPHGPTFLPSFPQTVLLNRLQNHPHASTSHYSSKLFFIIHPRSFSTSFSLSAASSSSIMEEYYQRRSHLPAFGSWDWNDNLPFTQCFESATQAGFFRCTFSDPDLYVAGDLYQNQLVTPTMIVLPRRTKTKVGEKEEEGGGKQKWVSEFGGRSPNADARDREIRMQRPTPKPVDEDLYTISPHLLYQKPTKKRGLSFFSSCLLPTCIA